MCCKYVKIQTLIRDQRQRIIRSQLFPEEKFHPDRFDKLKLWIKHMSQILEVLGFTQNPLDIGMFNELGK